MIRLEDLQPNAAARGLLPDSLVTVVSVQWFGSEALELTYKTPSIKSQFRRTAEVVSPLRDLQDIRSSGAAHRKGSRYEHVIAEQGIAGRSLSSVFDEMLEDAIKAIDALAKFFLSSPGEDTA